MNRTIAFQGNRNISPETQELIDNLSPILVANEVIALVGAYGELPFALKDAGIKCIPHLYRKSKSDIDFDGFETPVDATEMAEKIGQSQNQLVAHAIRMAIMNGADALCFLPPGEKGTYLQAIHAVLTCLGKTIAFVGWPPEEYAKIEPFIKEGVNRIGHFNLIQAHELAIFLLDS